MQLGRIPVHRHLSVGVAIEFSKDSEMVHEGFCTAWTYYVYKPEGITFLSFKVSPLEVAAMW